MAETLFQSWSVPMIYDHYVSSKCWFDLEISFEEKT